MKVLHKFIVSFIVLQKIMSITERSAHVGCTADFSNHDLILKHVLVYFELRLLLP